MKQISEKIVLLLIGIVLFGCVTDFKSNDVTFDSVEWKNGDLRVRGQMSKDLEKSKVLEGKTKTEVKSLLGEPNHTNDTNSNYEHWSYETDKGTELSNDVWIHYYNIEFDKKGETVNKTYTTD